VRFAPGAALARVVDEAEPPPREPAESGYFPTAPQVSEEPSVPAARRRLRSSLGVAFAAALAVGAVVLGARASAPEARARLPGVGVATSGSATSPAAQPVAAQPAAAQPEVAQPGAAQPAPAQPAARFEVPLPTSGVIAATVAYPVARAPLVEVDARPARALTFAAVRAARGPGAARPSPSGVHGGLSSPGF
jgi:hypothetical protein